MENKRKGNKIWIVAAVAVIAIALVVVLVVFVPKSAKAKKLEEQLNLGDKYLSELQYEQAVAAYLEAIEIDPKNVDAYLGLADAYIAQGDYDKAIEVLEEAVDELDGDARDEVKDKLKEVKKLKKQEQAEASGEDTVTSGATNDSSIDAPSASAATKYVNELGEASVGALVRLGQYEQDNDIANGKEAIEWFVVSVEEGKALLLSKYCLAAKQFHTESGMENRILWEESSLRQWLNDEFYESAFSSMEKEAIYKFSAGSDRGLAEGDKVFVPAVTEIQKFVSGRYGTPLTASAKASDYALVGDGGFYGEKAVPWWARDTYGDARYIDEKGHYYICDESATIFVRPALWVDLSLSNLPITKESTPVEYLSYIHFLQSEGGISGAQWNGVPYMQITLGEAEIKDTVLFGKYKGDNIQLSYNKEPLEWLVLDKKDGKTLLLSKYCISKKMYHDTWEAVTWENCTIRNWLNNDFFAEAFDETEKSAIQTSHVDNSWNGYETTGGEDTEDKVFLLSMDEVNRYLPTMEEKRVLFAYSSSSLQTSGVDISFFDHSDFFLRNPGYGQEYAAVVEYPGAVSDFGTFAASDSYIRPAIWVDNSALVMGNISGQEAHTEADSQEYFKFGTYEQDGNVSNGKEEIEWIILEDNGDEIILLSRYVLADMEIEYQEDRTWEASAVRQWLNTEFYSNAFSAEEAQKIIKSNVENRDNSYAEAAGGNDTEDYVYLLSVEEAERYLRTYMAREARATEAVKAAGAGCDVYNGNTDWLLRTTGNGYLMTDVNGEINKWGHWVYGDGIGIRPVICIKK